MKKRSKVLIYIISVFLAAALFSAAAIVAANDVFAFCKSGSECAFVLEEESMVGAAAKKLGQEGIISFPLLPIRKMYSSS